MMKHFKFINASNCFFMFLLINCITVYYHIPDVVVTTSIQVLEDAFSGILTPLSCFAVSLSHLLYRQR